jgi:hypothetical protein
VASKGEESDNAAELAQVAALTPFKDHDLAGKLFARGNMLGGASPVATEVPAPWKKG